jgi:hypothetical protein
MAQKGWTSVSVRDETKERIDLIAEEEEMTITGVIDSSVGFVFEEFYTEADETDPQIQHPDGRRPDISRKDPDIDIEL